MVGAAGNVGGVLFAVIFRFEPTPVGQAFWISGIIAIVSASFSSRNTSTEAIQAVNVLLSLIRVPKW